jgi:hypothetical protein
MSVLEGSDAQENWAMDFGGVVAGGSGDKAGEAEDILGTIAGDGGVLGHLLALQNTFLES